MALARLKRNEVGELVYIDDRGIARHTEINADGNLIYYLARGHARVPKQDVEKWEESQALKEQERAESIADHDVDFSKTILVKTNDRKNPLEQWGQHYITAGCPASLPRDFNKRDKEGNPIYTLVDAHGNSLPEAQKNEWAKWYKREYQIDTAKTFNIGGAPRDEHSAKIIDDAIALREEQMRVRSGKHRFQVVKRDPQLGTTLRVLFQHRAFGEMVKCVYDHVVIGLRNAGVRTLKAPAAAVRWLGSKIGIKSTHKPTKTTSKSIDSQTAHVAPTPTAEITSNAKQVQETTVTPAPAKQAKRTPLPKKQERDTDPTPPPKEQAERDTAHPAAVAKPKRSRPKGKKISALAKKFESGKKQDAPSKKAKHRRSRGSKVAQLSAQFETQSHVHKLKNQRTENKTTRSR